MLHRRALPLTAALVGLMLAGCDTVSGWIEPSKGPPLPGKRESILARPDASRIDPTIADRAVTLPPAVRNDWPQRGGNPEHVIGNAELGGGGVSQVFRVSIGAGSNSSRSLIATPVIAGGRIYAVDAASTAVALDARSGGKLWSTVLAPENARDDAPAGGVAFADGRVFAATGYGEVVALDAGSGSVVWRTRVSAPLRGAPTVSGGRVYVVALDNQAHAFSADKGEELWSVAGLQESADVMGAASPAVSSGTVVLPFSSGEVFGVRAENGRVAWQETLATSGGLNALSSLAAIRGLPVIDRGLVIATSHSGRTTAIDERSGSRVWEVSIGGAFTPWSAGDWIFVLDNDARVAAISRKEGKLRWSVQLDRWEKPEDRKGAIAWAGPVAAGGRLWLTNSLGRVVALSPADGQELGGAPLPGATYLPPVVAGGLMYVLSDDGTLTAFQ